MGTCCSRALSHTPRPTTNPLTITFHESRSPHFAATNRESSSSNRRCFPARARPRPRPAPRPRLRSLPHRPPHRGRRTPSAPPANHPRPPDRRRDSRSRQCPRRGGRPRPPGRAKLDTSPYCRRGEENLCDSPTFTGYTVNGGYAEYALARADFVFPIPAALDDLHAAPLLCAGIIGFRSLRVAGVQPGECVGLFGFGASAHLALPVLRSWNCEVFVATRGESHGALARSLGADWVGTDRDRPPVPLDRAITFAPSGDVVVAALASLRK